MSGADGRVRYFDALNVLACYAVVTLHVNSAFWSFANDARWLFNLAVESLLYPAVAIFFMLSGATLMDYRKRYTTREYFKKRAVKVALPFVLWSLIAIVFHVLKGQLEWAQLTPQNLLRWLVNCDYYNVYWFFAPLFACYLAIPVLSAIPEGARRDRVFLYAAAYAFITISLAPMVARWTGVPWNQALNTPVSAGYVMYLLLGYLLSRRELPRKARVALYALAVGATILRAVMTWRLSLVAGYVDYAYGDYVNFPCVLQALAVFVFFRQRKRFGGERVEKSVRWLAAASFSVYLTHRFVMDILARLGAEPAWLADSALHSVLWPPVVYGLSVGLYALGRRVPLVRRLFP